MSLMKSPPRVKALPAPAIAIAASSPMVTEPKLNDVTERLAYELFEKSGRIHGHDREHWLEAEKAAREQLSST